VEHVYQPARQRSKDIQDGQVAADDADLRGWATLPDPCRLRVRRHSARKKYGTTRTLISTDQRESMSANQRRLVFLSVRPYVIRVHPILDRLLAVVVITYNKLPLSLDDSLHEVDEDPRLKTIPYAPHSIGVAVKRSSP
jgi:hypothetical protein